MKNSCTSRGFTLVELLVVILLVAIVTMFAVPSFKNMIIKNRVSAATSEFLAALNFARNEAITRGEKVSLSLSGSSWTISVDSASTTNIREHEAIQKVNISGTSPITFTRLGAIDITGSSKYTIKAEDCPTNLVGGKRTIDINATGRVVNEFNPGGTEEQLAKITC
ncbi:hypothetical protein FACS1894185_5600 [Betaproteobacteria bacterium]|nr:hypothetical protein FACS1894185_5600 [Betaproteobacteria bacterium]